LKAIKRSLLAQVMQGKVYGNRKVTGIRKVTTDIIMTWYEEDSYRHKNGMA